MTYPARVERFLMRGRGPPDEEVEASLQTWKPVWWVRTQSPGARGKKDAQESVALRPCPAAAL